MSKSKVAYEELMLTFKIMLNAKRALLSHDLMLFCGEKIRGMNNEMY
jgi:hypothetical protein